MKEIKKIAIGVLLLLMVSCDSYLDVVPDNVATVDHAFNMRNTAEKYLFTCYRYLPSHASLSANPAFTSGDEFWFSNSFLLFHSAPGWQIARGNQGVVDPILNYWDGVSQPFRGIRDCNIFMENIGRVPDMEDEEKNRWIAETKFLKAYYHFWLMKLYGPIPIIRENLPVTAPAADVRVVREPIDDVVAYIVGLLDEAVVDLPAEIPDALTGLGRITQPIALSLKAKVLVTAASPLFNGNTEYIGFAGPDGRELFNQTYSDEKWQLAADACRAAIEACHEVGMELYTFESGISQYTLSEATTTQMSIRNSVAERWNSEIIWGNTNSTSTSLQRQATPPLDPSNSVNQNTLGNLAPPIKIAEQFYSKNGVPIAEDVTYDYAGRFDLREAEEADKYHLQTGYTTVGLHFDREERFYASLAFDGGLWYGQGRLNDNDQWTIQAKLGQAQTRVSNNRFSVTGYWPKKLVNYENIIGDGNTYTIQYYPWPVIRLADMYLLYAEALNEVNGPSDEAYDYVDRVRKRAGLPTVEEAWTTFSRQPDKYTTKEGFRSIIQQERLNELAFEGKRFWDLRRWKRAHIELNNLITGWDIDQENPETYYRQRVLYNQTFMMRDYFWPIREHNLIVNRNLVQNPGW
ncbi:RagB/SusD family nutrient uptake outer membrane protein [Parapedobacter sp. 10938]|uniref:RagB/SusD family nutrient uptake outer membrane protein n=1 Tax=Parapedobacter flavus TaxID=3110225 RepID=UPI002DB7A5B3|nr:RagB/SusD family nutrient uptake outer membrane protein [Parapedobacter sp. 10938]MEC3878495.1 RagB/SusD family nutrient uptake outer membrane protein [Parapedobacter sp. 10938]